MRRSPDTGRGPDVSYVQADRIPAGGTPEDFWEIPPDLAVEVVSPSESAEEVREAGTRLPVCGRATRMDRLPADAGSRRPHPGRAGTDLRYRRHTEVVRGTSGVRVRYHGSVQLTLSLLTLFLWSGPYSSYRAPGTFQRLSLALEPL